MAARITGTPTGSSGVAPSAIAAPASATSRSVAPGSQPRPDQGEERGRPDDIQPERLR